MVKGPCAPTCCVTVCDESGHAQPTVHVQKVVCRPRVDDGKYPGQHSLCVCAYVQVCMCIILRVRMQKCSSVFVCADVGV